MLLATLLLAGTASAKSTWWDEAWTLRKKITVDTTANGGNVGEQIGGAVVLVRLFDGNLQFANAKEDGSDIRFVAEDDKTLLTYHIERYDSLLNEAFAWVKLPEVKPGAQTSFWLYYANQGEKAVSVNDAKGTYDADSVAVYHFAERGTPASDSTSNGNNSQNAGTAVEGALIAGGLRLAGQAVTIPASPSLAWASAANVTLSIWLKPSVLQPNAILVSRREAERSFLLGLDNGMPFIEVSGQRSSAGAPIAVNAWRHLAVVASGGTVTLYLDGETYGTLAAAIPALNANSLLGGDSIEGATGFNGEVDELQISRVARSVGWVKLAAFSQGADKAAKLLAFGEDEAGHESWLSGDNHFAIIIKNLTFDGWLVIGLLAIMFVISFWLMFTKVSYLNALSKGNAFFMKAWSQLSTDLTALDHSDAEKVETLGGLANDRKSQRALKRSSVYRIYHIGAEEIRHRLGVDGGNMGLSGRSVQAIRAALDGGLVREKQKIDRLIVLLTICISGGPFLGLLGTVVGVMITFAAVAAAGEVNVNAIAPGIAAALLATVAGLAVAIPSLFGYNYILSRVKDATADMHVFIDEFVAKMAEFYSEKEVRRNPNWRDQHPELQTVAELVEEPVH